MSKKLVVELKFDEIDYGDGYVDLFLKSVERHSSTTLTEGEIDHLGEEIGQSDFWQIEVWNVLQDVMGNPGKQCVKVTR